MTYPMIIHTLHDFGLITLEEAEQAIETWNREEDEMRERRDRFHNEWKKRTPLWRRWLLDDWVREFIKSERQPQA